MKVSVLDQNRHKERLSPSYRGFIYFNGEDIRNFMKDQAGRDCTETGLRVTLHGSAAERLIIKRDIAGAYKVNKTTENSFHIGFTPSKYGFQERHIPARPLTNVLVQPGFIEIRAIPVDFLMPSDAAKRDSAPRLAAVKGPYDDINAAFSLVNESIDALETAAEELRKAGYTVEVEWTTGRPVINVQKIVQMTLGGSMTKLGAVGD